MSVLFLEDESKDIKGLQDQCAAYGVDTEVARTFCEGARFLARVDRVYDLVVIDIMLPWGEEVPNEIAVGVHSDRRAGLYLLQGMRENGTGAALLSILHRELGIPFFYGRHLMTPVVMLSKIEELADECRKLDIVNFFNKVDYDRKSLLSTILRYAKHGR